MESNEFLFDVKSSHESWRTFKIMAEIVEGFETLNEVNRCVSIFGSARSLPDSPYYHSTEKIARKLVENNFGVITGGGPGLMEAGNKGATEAGGTSVGLHICLPREQLCNEYVKTQLKFRYFFIRKLMFVKYAMAYIVMPGGLGTIDELSEAFVLMQTQKIKPFPIILYDSNFWGGLIDWIKTTMVNAGFIRKDELDLITIKDTPEEVVEFLLQQTSLE